MLQRRELEKPNSNEPYLSHSALHNISTTSRKFDLPELAHVQGQKYFFDGARKRR